MFLRNPTIGVGQYVWFGDIFFRQTMQKSNIRVE